MENPLNLVLDEKYGIIKKVVRIGTFPNQPLIWIYSAIGKLNNDINKMISADLNNIKAKEKVIEKYLSYYAEEQNKKINNDLGCNDDKYCWGTGCSVSEDEASKLALFKMFARKMKEKVLDEDLILNRLDLSEKIKICNIDKYELKDFSKYQYYVVNDIKFPVVLGVYLSGDIAIWDIIASDDFEEAILTTYIEVSKKRALNLLEGNDLLQDSNRIIERITIAKDKILFDELVNSKKAYEKVSVDSISRDIETYLGHSVMISNITTPDLNEIGLIVKKVSVKK